MDTLVEITKLFDEDREKLSQKELLNIKEKLNNVISNINDSKKPRQFYRLRNPELKDKLINSLFFFRIDSDLRVILSYVNDPLFNQNIMTLYRVVNKSESESAYKSVFELLCKDFYASNGRANGRY